MKRILLLVGVFAATMASAFAGNELGNGGDGYAQEFVALGRSVVANLKEHPDPAVPDVSALERAVEETGVVTVDHTELNGATVDAINYPDQKKIEVNRARWREYSPQERESLVLHEYLGIAKVEDSHYQISGNYSAATARSSVESGRRDLTIAAASGLQSFSGNIGKLYRSSEPTIGVRLGYLVNPYWIVRAELENSRFKYTAAETGGVGVDLLNLSVAAQFHFLRSNQWSGGRGVDPYLVAKAGQVFRRQAFHTLNMAEVDNASSVEVGVGALLPITSRGTSLWIEGRAGQIFFKDRNLETFLPESGIPDTTGMLMAGSVGLQWYF